MVSVQNRKILFNFGCIPIRVGLLLIIYFYPLQLLAILTGIISLGFLYRYLRPKKFGSHTLMFGKQIYWSRFFHFFTYLVATILLIIEETREYAYIALAVDIIIGFLVFWNHYKFKIKLN